MLQLPRCAPPFQTTFELLPSSSSGATSGRFAGVASSNSLGLGGACVMTMYRRD